jgi:serpin B
MRRRLLVLIAIVVFVAAAAAMYLVTQPDAPEAQAQPALGRADTESVVAKDLVGPLDAFGLALLRRQAERSREGNVVVSPFSLHAVLSMVLNGAEGATAAEMRAALGLEELTGDPNQGWADLITLAQAGKEREVRVADSLWLRDGVAFREPFLDTNRDYFAAEMRELPADSDAAAAAINDWVEDHTAGRIKDIVQASSFNDQTILALFNTIHLKVKWEHFEDDGTTDEPFTLTGGEKTDVPMMHAFELEAPAKQTERYDAVALSTKGPVTVWVIVPKKGVDAEELLGELDARQLEALYRDAQVLTGCLALPRFTTTYEAQDLEADLAAMGMPRAFSPSEAEFSRIADVGSERVFISKVVQKTFVEFNEEGVEAAAASGAIMETTGMPLVEFDIRADHPFLFVLTEKATQAPLFMGLIRDPR